MKIKIRKPYLDIIIEGAISYKSCEAFCSEFTTSFYFEIDGLIERTDLFNDLDYRMKMTNMSNDMYSEYCQKCIDFLSMLWNTLDKSNVKDFLHPDFETIGAEMLKRVQK